MAKDSEHGVTLVELLVYIMLSSIVLAIASAFLISMLQNSSTTTAVGTSSTAAQLTARSIETGIRNSSDFNMTNPTGSDQMVVARVISRGAAVTWSCQAWYYSATEGSVRTTSSAAAIVAPTAAQLATWTLLNDGVVPLSGTTIFAVSGRELNVAFKTSADGHPPVAITTSAFSRAGATGSVSCY